MGAAAGPDPGRVVSAPRFALKGVVKHGLRHISSFDSLAVQEGTRSLRHAIPTPEGRVEVEAHLLDLKGAWRLPSLSRREAQAIFLVCALDLPLLDAAKVLGVTDRTVSSYVEDAAGKIAAHLWPELWEAWR